jgi:hypothetical protein
MAHLSSADLTQTGWLWQTKVRYTAHNTIQKQVKTWWVKFCCQKKYKTGLKENCRRQWPPRFPCWKVGQPSWKAIVQMIQNCTNFPSNTESTQIHTVNIYRTSVTECVYLNRVDPHSNIWHHRKLRMVHGSQYHRNAQYWSSITTYVSLTNAQIHCFCKTSVFLKGFLTVETIWKLASDFSLICELTIDRRSTLQFPCSSK